MGAVTCLRRFASDRSGAVAIVFGLLLVPLAGLAGLAIDHGRKQSILTKLQQVADAAVVAGAQAPRGRGGIEGERFFMIQAIQTLRQLELPSAQVTDAGEEVRLHVGGQMPTAFLGLLGIRTLPVEVRAAARRERQEDPCDRATLQRSELVGRRQTDGRVTFELCEVVNRLQDPGPRRYGQCRPVTRTMCDVPPDRVRLVQ